MQITRDGNYQLAHEMLSLGAMANIVHFETGIPIKKLRGLYWEIHGSAPPRGQLPHSLEWINNLPKLERLKVTIFACLLNIQFTRTPELTLADSLVRTFKRWRLMGHAQTSYFDFNKAWLLARGMATGRARVKRLEAGVPTIELNHEG